MLDVKQIRKDFPMCVKQDAGNGKIYFDNAATTFKPYCVIDAVTRYYTDESVNIHRGDYDLSYQVSEDYEQTRRAVAQFLNSDEREVIFTSGASASLNLFAYGWAQKFLKKGDIILSSEAEHASNILPLMKAAEVTGAIIEYIPLTLQGELTIEAFKGAMNDKVKLVSIAHISNVLGYIQPIKEITKIAHEYGAIISVDGAQSVPHINTDVKDWDIDFLSFSAHKMVGPTGVGVLFGKFELLEKMDAFMLGGGNNARFDICGNIQLKNPPFKFEAGTPAIEAVLGLRAAVEYLEKIGMDDIEAYEHELKTYAVSKLKDMKHVILYNEHAGTGIITFNVEGIFAQDTAVYLNSKGIMVRAGNHCAKILVELIKTSETVRASVSFYNTKEEVDALVEALRTITLEQCIDLSIL
jgi:cysteine desulfurase / selenocysteine lyase